MSKIICFTSTNNSVKFHKNWYSDSPNPLIEETLSLSISWKIILKISGVQFRIHIYHLAKFHREEICIVLYLCAYYAHLFSTLHPVCGSLMFEKKMRFLIYGGGGARTI